MSKFTTILLALSLSYQLFSAAPLVPKTLEFAGIKLKISSGARSKIQTSVNNLHRSKAHFNELVELADLYFPVIEREFSNSNFPEDIKYLCIQESGFQANAVSSSKAVGYWQFKKATAQEQGLRVDRIVDERKNLVSSSKAAARYITAHNRSLDNWVYAVIAYNTGLGGVKKYYKSKYKGVKTMEITKNTHWYFLKFLAHYIAFKDFVGNNKPKQALKYHTETAGKNLKYFAKSYKVPVSEIRKYNYWINESKKIPSDKAYVVVVPVNYEDVNRSTPVTVQTTRPKVVKKSHKKEPEAVAIKRAPKKNLRYKVNGIPAITAIEGDNSSRLAIKGRVERSKFLAYNELKSFEELVPGQTYFLRKKKSKSKTSFHTAQHGETLWSISQHYGIKTISIRRKNKMRKTETVVPGRVLWLREIRPEEIPVEIKKVAKPQPKVTKKVVRKTKEKEAIPQKEEVKEEIRPKAEASDQITHWVQSGETLYSISRLYNVEVDQIKEWNKLISNDLKPGSRIKIKQVVKESQIISQPKDLPDPTENNEEPTESEAELSAKEDAEKLKKKIAKEEAEKKRKKALEEKKRAEAKRLKSIEDAKIEELKRVRKDSLDMVKSGKIEFSENEVSDIKYQEILLEPGATLYFLSREYGVSVEEIKRINGLTSNALSAGMKLKIPVISSKENTDNKQQEIEKLPSETSRTYTVKPKDTLYSVARKLGVSVAEIKAKNNKTNNAISIGEVLTY